ncbi:hypothetical protein CYY_001882 [Polysphondylium violaceum]|uniref:Orn/DAP/Arg decarboxylase 2 N-terminal domain-containing protein n=1 Tax=Polysphondylium violaceum TaxID=133409 RepID=A0A8J4Q0B7_9MYCE|nr:hypothetical protein CYY_001882 [Polysphondylium violaceum]
MNPLISESVECLDWKKKAIQKSIDSGAFQNEPYLMLYNLDEFRALAKEANDNFKGLQTVAVKCNPVLNLLKEAINNGLGAEVASFGELQMAERAGFDKSKIIFDSPIKTIKELEYALNLGCIINVDNFQELEIIEKIINAFTIEKQESLSLGLRINPQVGVGKFEDLSTGVPTSKFGIAMEYKDGIVEAYKRNRWLKAVHLHVGSQGYEMEETISAIEKVMSLVEEINQQLDGQIKIFNIGGGLPINYNSETINPTFTQYGNQLKEKLPQLFDGSFLLITEFGRAYWAKCGVIVSKVEYTKTSGHRNIAIVHVGGNICIPTIYQYPVWKLRVSIFDGKGEFKSGLNDDLYQTDLAGPLCFASDLIAKQRILPLVKQSDYVMVHDCGAYLYSSYSHYNLRLAPPIYNYNSNLDQLEIIKKGETMEQKIEFFS